MPSTRRDAEEAVHTLESFQTRDGKNAALAIFTRAESYFASRTGSVTRAPSAMKSCSALACEPLFAPASSDWKASLQPTAANERASTTAPLNAPKLLGILSRTSGVSCVLDRTNSALADRN